MEQLSINRTKVEFKVLSYFSCFIPRNCINRTKVEFKGRWNKYKDSRRKVLIEPKWNLKQVHSKDNMPDFQY